MRGFALCVLLASAAVFRAEISHASTGKGPKELSESTQYCSAGGCETIDVEHDLETVSDSGLTGSLFSFAGNAWATVKSLVQSTDVYKKVTQFAEQTTQYVKITIEKTAQYFEDLRSAIREEFYKLMEAMWERSMGALFSEPDTLFGKFSQAVANKIMAIGLIIICLILDYIFWQLYFSILFILAFDGTILLMYKVWGPVWVYSKFWYTIHYVWYLLSFVRTHPNIATLAIGVLFMLGITIFILRCFIMPIRNWFAQRRRERQLDIIEQTVLQNSMRLSRVEERQEEILELLKDRNTASIYVWNSKRK